MHSWSVQIDSVNVLLILTEREIHMDVLFKRLTILTALSLLSFWQSHAISADKSVQNTVEKPNILLIMSDDHAATAIGAYQSRLASLNPTPILDALAKDGTLFTNTFVTNSICTPSRVTILTGQYSHKNGALSLGAKLPADQQYLTRSMSSLGYETAVIGKWHIRSEPGAFDHYEVLESQGDYNDPTLFSNSAGDWPHNAVKHKGHSSDVITDRSLHWLKQRKNKQKPFFLMHHFKAPHGPFTHHSRYNHYLANETIPEPASLLDDPQWGSEATRGKDDALRNVIGSSVSKRHPRSIEKNIRFKSELSGDARTKAAYQAYLKKYLRAVKGVDDNIGRLLDYLKANGLDKNTIVIYTSDQGFMLGEHDLIDKRWMYEESLRMPLIIYDPRKQQVNSSDVIINNTDFAPTILSLAGAQASPSVMQGFDFSAALEGKPFDSQREVTYYRYWSHMRHHYNPAHFGIRDDRYKLIFYYGRHYHQGEGNADSRVSYAEASLKKQSKGKAKRKNKKQNRVPSQYLVETPVAWEFYDLTIDPEERINRYNEPSYQSIIRKLKEQLATERLVIGEDDANRYPHIQKVIDANWN